MPPIKKILLQPIPMTRKKKISLIKYCTFNVGNNVGKFAREKKGMQRPTKIKGAKKKTHVSTRVVLQHAVVDSVRKGGSGRVEIGDNLNKFIGGVSGTQKEIKNPRDRRPKGGHSNDL